MLVYSLLFKTKHHYAEASRVTSNIKSYKSIYLDK